MPRNFMSEEKVQALAIRAYAMTSCHGFTKGAPVAVKSARLRVTTVRPCSNAVAAINASLSDFGSGGRLDDLLPWKFMPSRWADCAIQRPLALLRHRAPHPCHLEGKWGAKFFCSLLPCSLAKRLEQLTSLLFLFGH